MIVRSRWLLLLPIFLTPWGWPTVSASDMRDLVAPYLRARDEERVGEVVGKILGDPPRPSAPPVPYEGVSVLLLPRSFAFDSELDEIKAHFRDSLRHYMGAAGDVAAGRTAYERALLWAGGGELIRGEVSDASGLVRLTSVPAGEWSLLAWRQETIPAKGSRPRSRETKGFRDLPMSAGHSVIRYWWTRLEVKPGETTMVELNDRNVWMAAVQEHLVLMEAPASGTGRRRR
jgi:hypothetical protein